MRLSKTTTHDIIFFANNALCVEWRTNMYIAEYVCAENQQNIYVFAKNTISLVMVCIKCKMGDRNHSTDTDSSSCSTKTFYFWSNKMANYNSNITFSLSPRIKSLSNSMKFMYSVECRAHRALK